MKLSLGTDGKATTCLVARTNIPARSVIFTEHPVTYKWANYRHTHCAQCCRRVSFGGVPCDGCASATFCGERCAAISKGHVEVNELRCSRLAGK